MRWTAQPRTAAGLDRREVESIHWPQPVAQVVTLLGEKQLEVPAGADLR